MLEDSKTLADYHIQQDSSIFVSIKTSPKDMLDFDECKACRCQAIDPCLLPCGHSCCKTCVDAEAAVCPVTGCQTLLNGVPRDALPLNWLATQFFDPKPEKEITFCQICAEETGTQIEATCWCQICSQTGLAYFCGACDATEHSSRTGRTHVRVPVDKKSSVLAFSSCSKHKLPEDSFCFDDNVFTCHMCRDEIHKGHKTKLVVECEKEMKQGLQSVVDGLTTASSSEEEALKKSQQEREADLIQLEEKMKIIKVEIEEIASKIKALQRESEKSRSASLVLSKSIDEYPALHLFDAQKWGLLKTRVDQTVKLLVPNHVAKVPVTPNPGAAGCFQASDILRNKPELGKMLENFFPTLKSAELLYNAAAHGWQGPLFHQQCDNRYDTVVLIEVGNYVFGGFTHLRWNETSSYITKQPDHAFLFSLTNPTNSEVGVKFPNNGSSPYSLRGHRSYGPSFGASDIRIPNNANSSASSISNFGQCYTHPTLNYGTNEIRTFFCGSYQFLPTNIEVFALTL